MLSVVVPVYNEDAAIINTLEEINEVLSSQKIRFEIIAVNDGSTDRTKDLLNQYNKIIVINRNENRGYGFSIKEGIKKAKGNWILITDADGSYPIESIPSFIRESAKYDMVVGDRSGEKMYVSCLNRFGKYILRILIYLLTSKWIKDINSGLRMFRKELALKYWGLIPDGFSLTTTLTVASMIEECRVKFIPIKYLRRVGKSKIRPIRDFTSFILLVLKIVSFFKPLRFFLPISTFFLIAAGLRCIRDIILVNSIGSAAILLFFLSIQTFFFGLLADLIVNRTKKYDS